MAGMIRQPSCCRYNILREESEGFAKLLTSLNQFESSALSEDSVPSMVRSNWSLKNCRGYGQQSKIRFPACVMAGTGAGGQVADRLFCAGPPPGRGSGAGRLPAAARQCLLPAPAAALLPRRPPPHPWLQIPARCRPARVCAPASANDAQIFSEQRCREGEDCLQEGRVEEAAPGSLCIVAARVLQVRPVHVQLNPTNLWYLALMAVTFAGRLCQS